MNWGWTSALDDLLRMSFSGMNVGLYRDSTRLLPIVAHPGQRAAECRQPQ